MSRDRKGGRGQGAGLGIWMGAGLLALLTLAASGAAAEGKIAVELNKLDAGEGGCKAFFLVENGTSHRFESLVADLILFDSQGVVSGRYTADFSPLQPGKSLVRSFALQGLPCEGLSRMLLNGFADCKAAGEAVRDCVALVGIRNRTQAQFGL